MRTSMVVASMSTHALLGPRPSTPPRRRIVVPYAIGKRCTGSTIPELVPAGQIEAGDVDRPGRTEREPSSPGLRGAARTRSRGQTSRHDRAALGGSGQTAFSTADKMRPLLHRPRM